MDLAEFRTTFPEMVSVSDATVNVYLAKAARMVDSEVFGTLYDDAHGYLTAHLLTTSPYAKNARLQSNNGSSTYEVRWIELRDQCTSGLGRVV